RKTIPSVASHTYALHNKRSTKIFAVHNNIGLGPLTLWQSSDFSLLPNPVAPASCDKARVTWVAFGKIRKDGGEAIRPSRTGWSSGSAFFGQSHALAHGVRLPSCSRLQWRCL